MRTSWKFGIRPHPGRIIAALGLIVAAWSADPTSTLSDQAVDTGRSVIVHWQIAGEPLTMRADPWFAGAINSIRYRGIEYLDSADHGRLLSAAVTFDGYGECLNPTLGGSVADGRLHRTSSKLLSISATADAYSSSTRMAYWMPPGAVHHVNPVTAESTPDAAQPCSPTPAGMSRKTTVNASVLSHVIYTQQFKLSYNGIKNAIFDHVTYQTVTPHTTAAVEMVTAYMPPTFNSFYLYDQANRRFTIDRTVGQHPGEQPKPVIVATSDGRNAFGVLAIHPGPTTNYGRFIFPNTTKWSIVVREGSYPPGIHSYDCVWVIGSLAEVESAMALISQSEQQ
jgi:hypothetical protein